MLTKSNDSSARHKKKLNILWIFAFIGAIIFIFVQLIPNTSSDTIGVNQASKIITKEQAKQAAIAYLNKNLNMKDEGNQITVTYDSRPDIYGYLSKEGLLKSYGEQYGQKFPYDVFKVNFKNPNGALKAITINVHMITGKVVGFEKISITNNQSKQLMLQLDPANAKFLLDREGPMTVAEKEAAALPYLKQLGYEPNQLQLDNNSNGLGLRYQVKDYNIGQSKAYIELHFEYKNVSSIETYFAPPASYTTYVDNQVSIASWLTYAGYGLLTFVLAILAIIYSAKTRAYTSFKRGAFLSACYFIFSVIGTLNMLPILEQSVLSQSILIKSLIFQFGITLMMSFSIYFSLVSGDGLYRAQGKILWKQRNEANYGEHVLQAMKLGYAWAFILLGVQSVLYFIMEPLLGTWSSTDPTQSPYNMVYPLLFPLLAWVAGIGEEAVYRLFGIPMLRKMFRSTLVASIVTTVIWALGHTLYPIYPIYTRPIELLFIGLIFSFIFLKHGYIAAMFAHVIFDSILMALSLILMGGSVNWIAGIFYMVLPAIVAYVVYRFNRAKVTSIS